jgi:hypothetical protein
MTIGGGHVSGELGFWHFGLGSVDKAQIRILWPDGEKGEWQTVDVGKFYVVERGKKPRLWE